MLRVAGVFRRLAAGVYDGLLLLALLMLVTALLQVITHGAAITRRTVGAWQYGYVGLLLAILVLYFGSAWTRRGATLGMKAWHVRVERVGGGALGWRHVLLRLACALPLYLLGIGAVLAAIARLASWPQLLAGCAPLAASYGWLLATGRGTLHDAWSGTRVLHVPDEER